MNISLYTLVYTSSSRQMHSNHLYTHTHLYTKYIQDMIHTYTHRCRLLAFLERLKKENFLYAIYIFIHNKTSIENNTYTYMSRYSSCTPYTHNYTHMHSIHTQLYIHYRHHLFYTHMHYRDIYTHT